MATTHTITQPDPTSTTLEGELLSLAEAKQHLALQVTAWDIYVRSLVPAAREYCEALCGHSLVPKTMAMIAESFMEDADPKAPPRGLLLRGGPVRAITSVKYLDATGTLRTLDPAVYRLTPPAYARPSWLRLAEGQSWPTTKTDPLAVRVEYSVGPGAVNETVAGVAGVTIPTPGAAKHACKLIIKHWFDARQGQASAAVDNIAGGGSANVPTHVESSVRALLRTIFVGCTG